MTRHENAGFGVAKAVMISAVSLGTLAVVTAAAAAAVTVYFARTVLTPPKKRAEDVRILRSDESTITFAASIDAMTPGSYSLWFAHDTGHARVGEILSYDDSEVTRALLGVDEGDLAGVHRGRFSGWFYLTPGDLGVAFEEVSVETELGPAPAWLVPAEGESDRWVIGVHGRAVRRQEAIRAVPVFRKAGYTSLLISYRNDGDAPATADNRYALGDTEWRDVESAMQYAVAHGARRIVLMGWSMGGATVLQALTRSSLEYLVTGVVLESPVVDWVTALNFQGAINRLPVPLRSAVLTVISAPWSRSVTGQAEPIDLKRLNFVARASELATPILVLHSDDDGYIPVTASRALAEARPDIVTFEEFHTARHTRLWNYDSDRWNSVIARWLDNLG
ncbi:alpha/beta fold hydrolase [soil metagenome]